ncbi:MAG TPA: hypothetical protein VMZ69_03605, partial [Saprospiraceae bacterium]|nr:hypothetical protein [Saprospiraceae bacterium]
MRSFLLLVILFYCGLSYGQGSGFSFSYTGPTQILVGQDCVAELDWGHPNTPTASSNLPGGMIVSFDIYSISGGYDIGDDVGGGTVVTVFYQAIDNFGNSALFGFSIAFIDNIPPVFDPLSLPPNLTVNCTGNFPVAAVEVHDNCEDQDIVLTVTFTETNNAVMCTGGIITRKWVADDDLGNFATFTQTITVLPDNTPPVIANNLVNGSAPCANAMAQYTTWLTAQRAAFSATDSGCGLMTLSDNAPSPSGITSFCGVITVTFSAKDNCNNISTVQKTFTVFNNVPPVITTPASGASGNCSQSNINQIFSGWINSHGGATATDDCSSIVWSTSPSSPTLSGACDTLIPVLFIAGDGCGNFDTTSANFMITDDTPPNFTTNPSTVILSCTATTIDSLLMDWLITSGHSVAHDLCTSDPQLIRGYRIGGIQLTLAQVLEAWEDSLAAGCMDNVIINGIGINNVRGYLAVEFTFEDACNNQTGKVGYFGITDNGRPVFVTQPADTSFVCSENENWQDVFIAWYNSSGGATYSDQCSNVSVQGSITADSALLYLTAALDTACMQGAGVTIQFSLIDDCGNVSIAMPSASFSLQDTVPPELISSASDLMASCSLNGQTQLNNWLDTLGGAAGTDGCGSLSWIFTWSDTSGALMNGVPEAGPYPLLSTLSCSSGLDVIFTVSDICQNSVSDTAVFSLIDTIAPVITIVDDSVHLSCQQVVPLDTPGVVDGCNGDLMIEYAEVVSTDSCGGLPETVTRIWTATDECGNSSTAQEIFFRIDSIAPTFQLPSDTVEFCSVDTLMLINLADNCDPSPTSFFEDIITGVPCQQMLSRTWTVSDACGNSATAIQTFDLSDFSPPVIQTSPGNFIYSCNGIDVQVAYENWRNSVAVVDGCSDVDYFIAIPGSYVLADNNTWPGTPLPDSVFLSCAIQTIIEGDLVAFDICGNVIVEQISFSVIDETPPVVFCPSVIQVIPDTMTCSGLVQLVAPSLEEICYPNDVKLVLIINNGDTIYLDSTGVLDTILEVGIHNAVWVATDCKGNTGTCETLIEIIDENAVVLTCPNDTLLFASDNSCLDSLWIHPPITSSGTCAKGVVELRFEIDGNANPDSVVFESPTDSVLVTFMAGIHQVSLIARDSTGDIDTCKFIVELRDTFPPAIICQNDTLFLHPAGVENVDLSVTSLVISTSDNCSIANIIYSPQSINCSSSGQNVDVMMVVIDVSGNSDTCTSSLFVTTQTLIPLWERGLCDDTLRLFANIPPGPAVMYTFNWSGPNGFTSNEENPIIPGADTSYSGSYTLTVQSETGCVSTGITEVLIQTLVSPQIVITDDTRCTGEELQLTTQTYSGSVSYQWYQITPAGDTIVFSTNDPSFLFTPVNAGVYTFFAVVTQDTCVSAPGTDATVFVFARPEVSIADIALPLCAYDTLFLSPSLIEDTLTYLWTGPGGFTSNLPAPPGIPANEIGFPSVFYLAASDLHCVSLSDSIEIILQPDLLTPVITGNNTSCEGGSFSLSASTPGDLYLWIDPSLNTTQTFTNVLNIIPAEISHSGEW